MNDISSPKPLALYIHWPFCKAKCPYCDFNSHVRASVDQAAWQNALISELRWYAAQVEPRALTSIFFGGGTPSLMPPATVEALLKEAESLFGFAENIEITLEANPTSVEAANFAALQAAGINRVSLGVQSLRPAALKFLGREHSTTEALEAVALAARTFNRYSFDLIYALPDQTLAEWEVELREALTHADKHLSIYQLTIEAGTQFFHAHAAGKITMPEGELAADFYQLTQNIMEEAGMPAYEISNHAASGEASRHNKAYWQGSEYIGVGPGAHGRLNKGFASLPSQMSRTGETGRTATLNLRSPEKWLAQVQNQEHGQQEAVALTHQEHREEAILMGLRLTEGLCAKNMTNLFDDKTSFLSLWSEPKLHALQKEGLITVTTDAIRPTLQGRMLLNSLTHALTEAVIA